MPYIVQDFNSNDFTVNEKDTVGDSMHHGGLWSGLTQGTACKLIKIKDKRSISFVAEEDSKCYVTAMRSYYKITSGIIEMEMDILRDKDQGLGIWFTDSGQWTSNIRIFINEKGVINYYDEHDSIKETAVAIDYGVKTKIGFRANVDSKKGQIFIYDAKGRKKTIAKLSLKYDQKYNMLVLLPKSSDDGQLIISNIDIKVSNPAYNIN